MEGIKAFWHSFYYGTFGNIDLKVKNVLGLTLLFLFLVAFIFSTRGKSKSNLINNWFLFWISMILLILGCLVLSN